MTRMAALSLHCMVYLHQAGLIIPAHKLSNMHGDSYFLSRNDRRVKPYQFH
jgi:hypothetical protein